MVLLICSIAVITPVVLVSLFASAYYYLGIESLFSEQVHHAFDETIEISHIYINEQEKHIKDDVLLLSNALDIKYKNIFKDSALMTGFLDQQTNRLMLSRAVLYQNDSVIAQTLFNFSFLFENISFQTLKKADFGIFVQKILERSKIRAIIRLDPVFRNILGTNMYLVVERDIDPNICYHLIDMENSAGIYKDVSINIRETRIKVIVIFLMLALALLIITIIFTNKLASLIVRPINNLVKATSNIKSGDYTTRVQETNSKDETEMLAKAFNAMMNTIDKQRKNLIHANYLINERRQFIETVLEELSTGVLTINEKEYIILYNSSAIKLLQKNNSLINKQKMSDYKYYDVFPELQTMIGEFFTEFLDYNSKKKNIKRGKRGEIIANLAVGKNKQDKRQFFVRAEAIYAENGSFHSIIVTFDDITELVAAQRFTAWVDIARRIAHEVKNPLTPIQLIVERLQKKFACQITREKDQFDKYLVTLDRRVNDMRKIIQEFVEFSRLSESKIIKCNIFSIIDEAIFLQQNTYPQIKYIFQYEKKACYVECDEKQIMQVMINLLKNSAESILLKKEKEKNCTGIISVRVNFLDDPTLIVVFIMDNGIGIEKHMLNAVCEPYITTKSNGMGLGLSIVKRIINEHGGNFEIKNNTDGNGVTATFTLKKISNTV